MGINSVCDGGKEENYNMNIMPVSELIDKVEEICKANGVKRLDLFGSLRQALQQISVILILLCMAVRIYWNWKKRSRRFQHYAKLIFLIMRISIMSFCWRI